MGKPPPAVRANFITFVLLIITAAGSILVFAVGGVQSTSSRGFPKGCVVFRRRTRTRLLTSHSQSYNCAMFNCSMFTSVTVVRDWRAWLTRSAGPVWAEMTNGLV